MTMPVGAFGAPPTAEGLVSSGSQQALAGLGSDGFLTLLIAQLRYQSPLEPSDPTDLMLQTAQLAQLDASQQLVSLQRRDLGLQQAVVAAGLIGTVVTGTTADGDLVEGAVDGVRYTSAGPVLDVGGRQLPLSDVTEIRGATADPDPDTD